DRMRQLAPLQFLVDLVFVSGIVYFAGGRGLDFLILLYPLIILSAGIILPLKQTIQITILAIIAYALVVLLMSQEILVAYPSYGVSEALTETPGTILLRICIFIFFGIASAYVSRRCDYINKKDKQFREITHLIFKNVKAGLLLLDSSGKIIMANDRACVLLGCDGKKLTGKAFSSIHLKPSEIKQDDPDLRGASDYFRRSDGSILPVSIEGANLTLPAEAIPDTQPKPDTLLDTRIINFNDLSYFLRLQSRSRQLERIRAAANMAKEMAHQIRSPLTGVSGAVQLLQLNLQRSDDASPAESERQSLCDQIVQEASRMEEVVQNFIDYAEFSPNDIR
ncbi:MAG TPA: histidine kinase dimerization/phospho-acceptor domain-containing protein, partial [Tichowtungia sp.]|nr:histidine kinase dimerization/phospho-acceptor domain-containing protein [Tichowtungia sp.]